ncbi:hypothetical protein L1987_06331 [Smallanthus sonchifolius]|uniref:Uncharacterized protein n=1 Tax=Smallanthus sonchifolius TaxID=185202 RepID=A0ACB9JXW3_9ASTR|nr:hypothetical protein L1987_06331 [Smallanthus sonchifolius]
MAVSSSPPQRHPHSVEISTVLQLLAWGPSITTSITRLDKSFIDVAFSYKLSRKISKLFLKESTPSSSGRDQTEIESIPNFSRAL